MTAYRPFAPKDTLPIALGLAFGAFYGFMGILVLWFILFDFGWMILLLGLPFLILLVALTLGFDRFLKWRRRDDPPPPPAPWARHHAVSLGAFGGASAALLFMIAGLLFGATP